MDQIRTDNTNKVFGLRISETDLIPEDSVFPETSRVTLNLFDDSIYFIDMYAGPNSNLRSYYCEKYDCAIYIWGSAVHPCITDDRLPDWILNVVKAESYSQFQDLIGNFVIIIDDRRSRRILFVSDILGVRPFFIGNFKDQLVFGSDVWAIWDAELISGTVDYDAVSAWLMYGYNCTSGSFFNDYKRLAPGSVTIIDGDRIRKLQYTTLNRSRKLSSDSEISEVLHSIISNTASQLYSRHEELNLLLSGGFDSRYLVALFSRRPSQKFNIFTIDEGGEGKPARQVADRLGLPIEVIKVKSSTLDLYDSPFHLMADGFPITKYVSCIPAIRQPGISVVNGFLGDSLVRGGHDKCFGKYEWEFKDDLPLILQNFHKAIRLDIIDDRIAERIRERSILPMEEANEQGKALGKVFSWADLYIRQRFYISNNFLQHLHLSEAVLPFYSWKLIELKLVNDYKAFNWSIYEDIFGKFFPNLADIPHNSQIIRNGVSRDKVSPHVRRWAFHLLPSLCRSDCLSIIKKPKAFPRLLASIVDPKMPYLTTSLERLFLLEETAKKSGVDFDWRSI